ncbi:uncharacterized protein LOC109199735 isoform X2 [Oreochromis niloticus]|uniref:uncharacterized protein LOC109199735 isoform X2 n=1 Tax=Oreochromis niloticus TaxID=8128 RepID=UPI000DF36DA6|nr:uncharacterized protein LOC109199735 isoform X2 [Oreochromis niloticus]
MKTPSASLLLGVCVLLLSAPTVSAVSLSVSPNLQQFFSGSSSVSLSCDDDGQTADGWTVKRTRGGLTEDCGAAAGFGRVHGSSCVLDRSVSSDGSYFCENSSGQQSDEVSIIVSDKGAILEIPALPVRTGNDLTMRCRERSGDTAAAYFSFNGRPVGSGTAAELVIRRVKQSDEGLYSCATDAFGSSPQSFLRVRGPPQHRSSDSTPPVNSSVDTPSSPPQGLTSFLTALIAGLVPVVLLVLLLVLVRLLFHCKKQNEANDTHQADTDVVYSDVRILTAEQSADPGVVIHH